MRYPYAPIRFIRTAIFGLALLCPNISQAQDFTSGLVGHWELDETSGTTATDSSASGNDGTMTAMDGASDNVTGQVGGALSFTSSSRITAGAAATNIDDIFNGGGTISYWIYPTSWGGFGRALDKSDAGGYPPNSGWHQQGTGTRAIFSHAFSGGTGQWELASGSTPLNTWSHLSITYDSSDPNNDPTFYINGTPVALFADSNATGTAISDAANPITLGSRQGGSNFYTGYIDDVRMYSRTLSVADITALYAYTGVNYTCSSPDGVTGEMLFNNDARALQYCNASSWVGIGPANSLENGLVGHWKLDETSGTTAADETGSYNGTMTGALTAAAATTSGVIGTSIHFDGSGDYINASAIPEMQGVTTLTLSGWLKRNALGDYVHFGSDNGIAGGTSIGYSGGTLYFATAIGSWAYGSYSLNDTQWHHVTMVYNGSGAANSDKIKGYIDGVEVALSYTGTIPAATYNNASNIMRIGRFSGYRSDGDIDDVRVYNRALSASEIAGLYNIPPSCTAKTANLAGHWKLDETSGSSIADASGNGNTGTWNDGTGNDVTEETIAGQDGTAIDFDGAGDRVSIGSSASIENVFSGGGAISMWIYPEGWGGCNYGRILEKAAGITGSGGWSIIVNNGGGVNPKENIAFYKGHSTTYSRWTTPFQSITLNAWNHITVSYSDDDLNNHPTIYINDTAQALTQNNPPVGTPDSDVGTSMRIGYGGGCGFDGIIDDVRVYDGPLSETEVSALYGATGGMCSVSTCTAPSGTTGEIVFNTDYDVMQYCNGSNWIAMGPPGDGGAGCTNPTGLAAELRYNTDLNVLQYCEGDDWIAVIGTNNASIPTAGLVGHWALDETSGTVASDSSGNGNDGTMAGGLNAGTDSVAGQNGTAMNFDGTNDYISITPYTNVDSFTVSLWVNPQSTTDNTIFVTNVQSNNPWYGWSLMMDRPLGNCAVGDVCMWMRSAGGGDWVDFAYDFPTNTWTHFAATYSTVTGYLTFYADGMKIFEELTAVAPDTSSASTASIGRGVPGWTPSDHFLDGSMDDVRIYNRSLSSSEILSLYNATK